MIEALVRESRNSGNTAHVQFISQSRNSQNDETGMARTPGPDWRSIAKWDRI